MKYEIDFIGLKKQTKDALAVSFRYFDVRLQRFVVGVYDGGLKDYGTMLREHLNTYYFANDTYPFIDYVICSHPDQDHASGLTEILDHFNVGTLVMNRPWLYIDELFPMVSDGRITKNSLEQRLRKQFPYVSELESLADEKGIEIQEGFQGCKIGDRLTILSPDKEFYLRLIEESKQELLTESSKTQSDEQSKGKSPLSSLGKAVQTMLETWTRELLREDVTTSPENESSIVLLGDMEEQKFLLTGDAGVRGLGAAADYAENNICSLKDVDFQQIPHHGGRDNVSPSILNRIVGKCISEGVPATKIAVASVAAGSDHPRKMVVNAYIRRGARVYTTGSNSLWHHFGEMPERKGWESAKKLEFTREVESWDD